MIQFIEKIGDATIRKLNRFGEFFYFSYECFKEILRPSNYDSLTTSSVVLHLYRSTVAIFPLFLFLAVVFGSALVILSLLFAINFNLQEKIGFFLISMLLQEIAPLFATLFVLLRYGVGVSRQKRSLYHAYIPKIVSSLLSIPMMAFIFAFVSLLSGFGVSFLYLGLDFEYYKSMIIDALGILNIVVLFFKSMVFALLSVLIELFYIHSNHNEDGFELANSILKSVGKILMILFVLELSSVFIIY